MSRIQGGWTAYNLGLTPSRAHFSHPLRLQCLSTVRWSWQAFWALSKTHNKTKTMQSLAVKSLSSVISIVRTWAHQPSISRIFFYCFLAGFGRSWSQQPHTLSPQEPPVRVEGEFFPENLGELTNRPMKNFLMPDMAAGAGSSWCSLGASAWAAW